MNFTIEIEQGEKEPIVIMAVDANGSPLTAKTDIEIRIRRISDGFYFDWSDDTFRAGGSVTTMIWPLVEVSALYSPGEYHLSKTGHVDGFDTSSVTNPLLSDKYIVTAEQSGGTDVVNVPMMGEIRTVETTSPTVVDRYPVIF